MNTRCSARTKHESSGKGHPVPAPTRHALVVCPDPLPDPDQPLDSIDKIIRNLAAMQARLSLLIDAQRDTTDTLAPLLALRTEIDSRLARLHHDQQVLASHAAVGASADRARTLDQITAQLKTLLKHRLLPRRQAGESPRPGPEATQDLPA